MRRSILALSAALFAAGAGASAALAQTSVAVYGLLDAGVLRQGGCAPCATQIGSGIASGSRLGFRASETLGNSLWAVFALEAGLLPDTGRMEHEGRLFGRQAWVGLEGRLGTVTLGRQYNLEYLAITDVADPFRGGMAGSAANLVGYSGRQVDNSIQYESRAVKGISARASYGLGEIVGDPRGNRAWGVSVGLQRGALTLRAAHQNKHVAKVTPATALGNNMDAKNTLLAANVRLGLGTAYAAYSANRGWGSSPLFNPDNPYGATVASTPSTDSRDVLVGVALPAGATTFLASFIRKDDRDLANRDADQVAVGATYAVSRRTDFYAAYSHIKNRNGAGYTVGNASAPGSGTSALNLGMRHAF